MTCHWCNGDHPSASCPHKLTIQEALDELGPIRAIRAGQRFQPDPQNTNKRKGQIYWCDGKLVEDVVVKRTAIERRMQKYATK